ncbi:MAG: hypothetical protein U5L95_00795 [Candidatus Saccharibacteria bacterium]|nr:hypothetical protein [Candidatus Saccharibacteria bacterium]
METKNWEQAGDRYFDTSKLLRDVQPGASRLECSTRRQRSTDRAV